MPTRRPPPHAPPPRRKSPLLPQGRAEVFSAQAQAAVDYGHFLGVQGTWGWRLPVLRGVSLASTARRRLDGHWLWLREEQNSGGFAQVRVRGRLCFGQVGRST
ncbi:hypothetical protein NN561_019322 [Cricetulus griseus]